MPGNRIKPYLQRPSGTGLSPDQAAFNDWVQTSLNALIGQSTPSGGQGIASVNPNTINPSGPTVVSQGVRANSITTKIHWIAQTTSITFYWDGTNGSVPLTIYRDDGTQIGPIVGNFTVSGLVANTQYFFFPYYQEAVNTQPQPNVFPAQTVGVQWATGAGAVGSPAIAFTARNLKIAQFQGLRDHIPLGLVLAQSGITTPNAGSTSGDAGGGGGGNGGWFNT